MDAQKARHHLYHALATKNLTQYVNALVIDEDKIYILTERPGLIIGKHGETITAVTQEMQSHHNFNTLEIRLIEYNPFEHSLIAILTRHIPKKVYEAGNLFEAIM